MEHPRSDSNYFYNYIFTVIVIFFINIFIFITFFALANILSSWLLLVEKWGRRLRRNMTLSENLEFCVEVFLSWKELCCLCENKCVSNLLPSHLFSPKGGLGRAQAFSNFNIPNFGQFFRNQSRQWKQSICCSPPICSRDWIAQTQSLSIYRCNFRIGTDW